MDSKGSDIQITLKNGDKVKVNDHVYCSPNWSIRDGTPYSVARIMEFLPPEDKTAPGVGLGPGPGATLSASNGYKSQKGKGREAYTRVRLAWYYRPSDVSDRSVADSRLLLAAIYSEICDVTQLRARCYVIHRDKLANLSDWKRKPDRFYFHRLFDPYIKKEFEVLLSTDVRNLPSHIRDVLISRYEYVVAEKEVVPDLTDSLRLCETCGEWCAHIDAVQCATCKGYFHMSCVNPPLIAKPSRGYGWTCAPCSRRHEDQVDSGGASGIQTAIHVALREGTPKSGSNGTAGGPQAKAKPRGRPRKDRTGLIGSNEEELQVKHYKTWPFRYFGLYTVAEDTMDPDDLIFPRTATRVGPKYQAAVPLGPGEPVPPVSGSSVSSTPLVPSSAGTVETEERGGNSTIEVLGIVNEFSETLLEAANSVMKREATRKEQLRSVDWLTEMVRRLTQCVLRGRPLSDASMKNPMRLEKWKKHETRYSDKEWNDEEVAAFEDGIAQFGAELRAVREEVGTRPMPEVVRFYGKWKNARLREENARLREPDAYKKSKIPRSGAASPAQRSSISDDDQSIVEVPPSNGGLRTANYCAACRTRDSRIWWKAPKGLATPILCDSCGMNWRKYADLNARPTTREESAMSGSSSASMTVTAPVGAKTRGAEKREGTPLSAPAAKRSKVTGSSIPKTSPPPGAGVSSYYRCVSCFRNGPHGKILKCNECGVTLHAGACGVIPEQDQADSWLCELCENEKTMEYSLNTDCLLCPRTPTGSLKAIAAPSETFLRACKPTEGQGWVHVLCAVFIPEVQFSDSTKLRIVEGVSTISKHRWTTKCCLCNVPGGAVVRCGNCPKEYHVSCAWKYGHKFGFEIQPVKSSRRDVTTMVTFKRETGAMNAVICCKDHSSYRRDTYDICDTNDVGETALQVYARTYKQAPIGDSHSLLRKAHRLDQLLQVPHHDSSTSSSLSSGSPPISTTTTVTEYPVCAVCKTDCSPLFHLHPKEPAKFLCHRCHFVEMGEKREEKHETVVDAAPVMVDA